MVDARATRSLPQVIKAAGATRSLPQVTKAAGATRANAPSDKVFVAGRLLSRRADSATMRRLSSLTECAKRPRDEAELRRLSWVCSKVYTCLDIGLLRPRGLFFGPRVRISSLCLSSCMAFLCILLHVTFSLFHFVK